VVSACDIKPGLFSNDFFEISLQSLNISVHYSIYDLPLSVWNQIADQRNSSFLSWIIYPFVPNSRFSCYPLSFALAEKVKVPSYLEQYRLNFYSDTNFILTITATSSAGLCQYPTSSPFTAKHQTHETHPIASPIRPSIHAGPRASKYHSWLSNNRTRRQAVLFAKSKEDITGISVWKL
jgi:hypothetical protein